jgi:hypothetical protein
MASEQERAILSSVCWVDDRPEHMVLVPEKARRGVRIMPSLGCTPGLACESPELDEDL